MTGIGLTPYQGFASWRIGITYEGLVDEAGLLLRVLVGRNRGRIKGSIKSKWKVRTGTEILRCNGSRHHGLLWLRRFVNNDMPPDVFVNKSTSIDRVWDRRLLIPTSCKVLSLSRAIPLI